MLAPPAARLGAGLCKRKAQRRCACCGRGERACRGACGARRPGPLPPAHTARRRFKDSPHVAGPPHICFFAGAPLVGSQDGHRYGERPAAGRASPTQARALLPHLPVASAAQALGRKPPRASPDHCGSLPLIAVTVVAAACVPAGSLAWVPPMLLHLVGKSDFTLPLPPALARRLAGDHGPPAAPLPRHPAGTAGALC